MSRYPTVHPINDFQPTEDAKQLKQAFKGFGCDEETIIGIITSRSNEQRQIIASEFKTMFGKDLMKELKSELRGDLEDVIVALMMPYYQFQAKQLHKAMSGLGTDEETLIEILGVHNNEDIQNICEEYQMKYETTLESDLKGDSSGTLKRLLVSLATGNRDESGVINHESAFTDAQELLQAGELLFAGTDESTFNAVLCQRNIGQLNLVFDEYEKITGHPFEEAIENEFSGTTKDSLLNLVACVRNKIAYLAKRLHDSMDCAGTDDQSLIRIVVSSSEQDLGLIKEVFEEQYGKSLAAFIEDDTSGDYKKCLLAVVG